MRDFNIDPFEVTFEPLAGSTFTNLLRLLAQNRFHIEPIGIPRITYSLLMSFALTPLNLYEKFRFDKQIKTTAINKPPIFILGHWRSGTTYLHNLMSQDTNFAYPTTFQTITPAVFLKFEKLIKPIVASSLPPTRPQDNIALGPDLPQEEEYGIGNLSPYSFYHGWCFPKNMDFYYNFVTMDNVPPKYIQEWKKIYQYYLKKITLFNHRKQLILKNPSNTARIKLLLELFPNAKFIHIYRNPYHVYLSMKRNIEKEMTLYCIQQPQSAEIFEQNMINMYKNMYHKYFQEKKLIPNNNLMEIKYENFVTNPYQEIKKIYETFNQPGFKCSDHKFKNYIASQKNVKTHKYIIDPTLQQKIYHHFKFTIDTWKYDKPIK